MANAAKVIGTSATLLLIVLQWACGGTIPETAFRRGTRLQKEGRLPAAARAYREAIEDDEEDARAHYNLGTVYHEIGKPEKARTSYKKALSLQENPRFRINLAAILEEEGKLPQALAELDRAVEADEESAFPLCYRGFFHERRGDLEKAMADYRAALENEPEDAYAHLRIGKLQARMGRIDEAQGSLEEAVRLDASSVLAWKTLGEIAMTAGETAATIRSYERLATLQPDEAGHRIALGEIYLRRGQPRLAARSLWKARMLDGSDHRIGPLLLTAYRMLLSVEVDDTIEAGSDVPLLLDLGDSLRAIANRIDASGEAPAVPEDETGTDEKASPPK